MRDRQNQNVATVDGVNQPVGKPAQPAAADALRQSMPGLGIARNAVRRGQHFDQERIADAGRLFRILADGVVELGLGNVEKPDRHGRYLATTSLRPLAPSSPRR